MAEPVTQVRVRCILVDHNFQRTLGGDFYVEVPSDDYIHGLKVKIKERCPNCLARVDTPNLEVWKLRNPQKAREIKRTEYLANLRRLDDVPENGDQGDDEAAWCVPAEDEISLHLSEPPKDRISVLVQVPAPRLKTGGTADGIRHGRAEGNSVLDSPFVKEYKDIFVKVKEWGVFQDSDLELNDIYDALSITPNFVTEFEGMLDRSQDSTVEDESHEETNPPLRYAERLEALHVAHIASYEWQEIWSWRCTWDSKSTPIDCLANAMFFFQLLRVPKNEMTIVSINRYPWPISLITKCGGIQPANEQIRKYRPCSDFLISKSILPRLLVAVDSTPTTDSDRIQMLLTGAAIVRFANQFLDAFRAKDFVFCVLFIYDDGSATRYTLFQKQNIKTVFYRTKEFSFRDPDGPVEFARQLYNLLHLLEVEDKEDRDTRAKICQLNYEITSNANKFNLKSLYHTQGTKKKCARTDDVDGAGEGGGDKDTADCAELRAHGYKVEPQVVVDAHGGTWEPLFEMPSHLHTVYRLSEPRKELIAKKVRKDSNELAILRRLNTVQPRSENIVSLLDSFDGQSGSWAILPKLGSVAHYIVIAPSELQSKVTQVCWGLIKGIAYLHGLRIAHRDIKPDNLLVDQDFCLKIIDFDIAMQVKDEDEEVNDECGTKHWMAPEVGNTSSTYSPIKADRWSCGHFLLYLLDKLRTQDEQLRAIGRKLEVRNPKKRPSLLEWHNWLPVPLLDMCDIRIVGEGKASRPRQDSMGVDGEHTTAPNAKKQRLSDSLSTT